MATSSHPMLYERLGGVYRIATVAAALTALFVVLYLVTTNLFLPQGDCPVDRIVLC
jgi:hypothetical protein